MASFVHPALLWGLGLAALPLLIHLINLVRQRRVEWAAMEFLLASQRKSRRWVWMKQLLLLAMRMAAVAAIVLVIAQPAIDNRWNTLLAGKRTHHVVLLDDSFSMSDRWSGTTAFDEAKRAIARLVTQLASQRSPQTLTLLRFSKAAESEKGTSADFDREPLAGDVAVRVESTLKPWKPSQQDSGPAKALAAVLDPQDKNDSEQRVVYVVSDFRSGQWRQPRELLESMRRLNSAGVRLHLVQCVDAQRPNLAVASIRRRQGPSAVGVPLAMEVSVRNFGTQAAHDVAVRLFEDGAPRSGMVIDQIRPGQVETRRFSSAFPTAGDHSISAVLPSDAVETDNTGYAIARVALSIPILIIDNTPAMSEAGYLAAALAPGGSVRTGLEPQVEPVSYLATHGLDKFDSIFVLDAAALDAAAAEALRQYVQAGGGLVMFVGQRSDTRALKDRYDEGRGLFPVPALGPSELAIDQSATVPDLVVEKHPMFRVFSGERNSFLASVMVERYMAVSPEWDPAAQPRTQIIARLRNGAPLVIERAIGQGNTVTMLSTASPTWNNWARNPSFVVAMLELESHLARRSAPEPSGVVGSRVAIPLDAAQYQSRVRIQPPGDDASESVVMEAQPAANGFEVVLPDTRQAGIYGVELTTTDQRSEVRRVAVNVNPLEGDLAWLRGEQLAGLLEGVQYTYHAAADFQIVERELAGMNLSRALLFGLIVLLLAEQLLAYSASYHPRTPAPVR